jgi:hypothetical protein
LLAFAQMFFIVYRQDPVCTQANDDDCNFPHCTFESSLLKVSCGLFLFLFRTRNSHSIS